MCEDSASLSRRTFSRFKDPRELVMHVTTDTSYGGGEYEYVPPTDRVEFALPGEICCKHMLIYTYDDVCCTFQVSPQPIPYQPQAVRRQRISSGLFHSHVTSPFQTAFVWCAPPKDPGLPARVSQSLQISYR